MKLTWLHLLGLSLEHSASSAPPCTSHSEPTQAGSWGSHRVLHPHFAVRRDSQPASKTEVYWMTGTPSKTELVGTENRTPRFPVWSLGWVEMSEEELAPGKSSVAVNSCIRQLAGRGAPPPGGWDQGRAMLLLLDRETLRLMEPVERTLLHAQPVASIRVWGVGWDDGR
uniref:PID domain-containing protein n=1 Tax=Chelonoidis abingdonii TaxID=106734 RepID=A0A8C0H9G3_CHEAB